MAMNSSKTLFDSAIEGDRRALAKLLTIAEEGGSIGSYEQKPSWILGITGPPGAGKSTLIDRLASNWSEKGESIAILAVDPSSPVSGGALLGDRARMVFSDPSKIYFRSVSSRGSSGGISSGVRRAIFGPGTSMSEPIRFLEEVQSRRGDGKPTGVGEGGEWRWQ